MVKKLLFILFVFCFCFINVRAEEISLKKCIDGDTVDLVIDGDVKKVRFLAVDTPETKHPTKGVEPFGKEASKYTCDSLKNASSIKLEYEDDKFDKYDRLLAWVFVDDNLLQSKLIENGLAKVAYLYGDYKYTGELKKIEAKAKKDRVGLWGDYKEDYSVYLYLIGVIVIVIIICIIDKSYRKKMINKVKRKAKKELGTQVNNLFK